MDALQPILFGALIAALFGALGYLLRDVFESRKRRREEREQERRELEDAITQLRHLQSLLEEAYGVFVTQNVQRNRLMQQIRRNQPDFDPAGLGYDETFYRLYDEMDEAERDLFQVVRGMTEYSMHSVNTRLRQWLEDNVNLPHVFARHGEDIEALTESLDQLRLHLHHWFSKYHTVFSTSEKRSLVYLGDEKQQGLQFPGGLSQQLERTLEELNPRRR